MARLSEGDPDAGWSLEEDAWTMIGEARRARYAVRRGELTVADAAHFVPALAAQEALEQLWRWSVGNARRRCG